MTDKDKVREILKHITRVERNCTLLGFALMEESFAFGKALIIRGRQHDISKLDSSLEFDYLWEGTEKFTLALQYHRRLNRHHPEFFPSINDMTNLDLAEMVCDCVARGQEFGTDVRKWFEEEATKKYDFKIDDGLGRQITKYLDLLLSKPFKTEEK